MFVQRTLDFLYYNRIYNSPDWYKSHKADYENFVLSPMKEFVCALAPVMLSIDPQFDVEAKVDRCISRIYRDMRYATDGFRYRDKIWCVFARDKKQSGAGYFFEVSPYSFDFGCGYFQADATSLKNFRQNILDCSQKYLSASKAFKRQKVFSAYGDTLKNYTPDPSLDKVANDWLSRQNVGLIAESKDINLLLSEDLPNYIGSCFKKIKDYYYLLRDC